MKTIRIGKRLYDDHCERDLIAPTIIRETKAHYFIDGADNEALRELWSDAEYYKDNQWFEPEYFGLCRSASATFNAICKHLQIYNPKLSDYMLHSSQAEHRQRWRSLHTS